MRRPTRITIPEGDDQRKRSKDDEEEEVNRTDPQGKRPIVQKKKKKKKTKHMVGTLIMRNGTLILVLLIAEQAMECSQKMHSQCAIP